MPHVFSSALFLVMPRILLVVFQQALVVNLVKNFLEIQLYHVPGTPVTPKLAFTPYNCSSFPKRFPFTEGRLALSQQTVLSTWSIVLFFIKASTLHVNIWDIVFVVRPVQHWEGEIARNSSDPNFSMGL